MSMVGEEGSSVFCAAGRDDGLGLMNERLGVHGLLSFMTHVALHVSRTSDRSRNTLALLIALVRTRYPSCKHT